MPVSTRSKTELKPVSKKEWNAVEALLFLKKTPEDVKEKIKATGVVCPLQIVSHTSKQQQQQRPHRSSATYMPGTFADMEE